MPEVYNDQHQLILSLLCITALVASAILYARVGTSGRYLDDDVNSTDTTNQSALDSSGSLDGGLANDGSGDAVKNVSKPKMVIIPQPACPPQDKSLELRVLCEDFLFAKFSCVPEDITNPAMHKIPKYYYQYAAKNNSNNETQNIIVNCIIAALLLTSLGAALLEFYRVKISPPPENQKKGFRAPVNRKCSLADLTVLKHHRKELVRRESILEHHQEEEAGDSGAQHQGARPFPLHRRCSFPASLPSNDASIGGVGGGLGGGGGGGFSVRGNSRKLSMTGGGDIGRRLSIVTDGGRKLSMVADEGIWRRGSVVGEDSSPERRVHHSRLVHRH